MSDYFSQSATVVLSQPADPWRIAQDTYDLLETLFGEKWKDITPKLSATSQSRIGFEASDLTSLQERVTVFGGPMRDISIDASLYERHVLRSCDTIVWIKNKQVDRITLHWYMPMRVDTESFRYGVERVIEGYRRRKRWSDAKLVVETMRHNSTAGASPREDQTAIIKVRGLKWGLRRWFVRNRDNIIVSLLGGLVITVGIIILQLVDLVPVPT